MDKQEFCVHSQVYTDVFQNRPYSMSMRENIEVTTPDLIETSDEYSSYYEEALSRYHKRIDKENKR